MTTNPPMVQAERLVKHYGHNDGLVRALDGIALTVDPGETVAVMGPSGCGKSTLLHLLGGLDRPTAGQIHLAGRRIDNLREAELAHVRRESIGFVFQAFELMEELTAAENVEFPALLAGSTPRKARRRAAELLERVGLADRAKHLPSALSGGQQQRVAIARALANHPSVVLVDEPTGNLDSEATAEVLDLFTDLGASGQTLLIVTHDHAVAAIADHVALMRDGTFTDQPPPTGAPGDRRPRTRTGS